MIGKDGPVHFKTAGGQNSERSMVRSFNIPFENVKAGCLCMKALRVVDESMLNTGVSEVSL